jgi:hypothetical protein
MIHGIPRSVNVEGIAFPGREDYLQHFDIGRQGETDGRLEIDSATAIEIQRDWHSRGQNGCVFAMHAARNLTETQWSSTVHDELPESTTMRTLVETAIDDPENQIHSFIFPNITTPPQLRELIDLSMDAGCIMREQAEIDGVEVFRLRWMLGDVESWVVGFASMADVPPTRRAPFTELVFRTKLKGKDIHPTLNNDEGAAHLANIDLGFDMDTVGKLIGKSKDRAARMLGGPTLRAATPGARAKTTYGITLGQSEEQAV